MQYEALFISSPITGTPFYISVTSNLIAQISEHKDKIYPHSFTAKYNICKLVWYESFPRIEEATAREKAMKKWKRKWKEDLIKEMNFEWNDLFNTL